MADVNTDTLHTGTLIYGVRNVASEIAPQWNVNAEGGRRRPRSHYNAWLASRRRTRIETDRIVFGGSGI